MGKAGMIADYEPTTRASGLLLLDRSERREAADISILGPQADHTNRISAEDCAMIAERVAMDGVLVDQERLWGFRGIASTNAVDSYYTRPDEVRALAPYAEDLKFGTGVLGNHDYDKFGYGSSYDGEVVDVEARDGWQTEPEYRATKGTLGKYFIVKGLSLNGEKTDDLIKAAQYGALRRLSVTFFPQRYECALDGKDMMNYECEHFPGIRYGDDKRLCYAWIQDSRLLETSLVFRNASPDSMLQRKVAEGIAQGEIPQGQLAAIAQRFMVALPTATRFAAPITAKNGGANVDDPDKREPADADKDADKTADADQTADQDADKAKDDTNAADVGSIDQTAGQDADNANDDTAERVLAPAERASAFEALVGTAEKPELETFAASLEERCANAGLRLPGQAAAIDREAQIRAALGAADDQDVVAAAKATAARAKTGDVLFAKLVDDAVKARVSRGDKFDAEKYRKHLSGTADADYVQAELDTHEEARRTRWHPGRVVGAEDPIDVRAYDDGPKPKRDDNVLAGITAPGGGAGKKPGTYAVPAKQKKS